MIAMEGIRRFRPLTGILFFNEQREKTKTCVAVLFPSPYGDFVFQLGTGTVINKREYEFPSPYGDFVFQHDIS